VLHINDSVRADAHFRNLVYGRENGSSATGGGLNTATITRGESKLVKYLGAIERHTIIDHHVGRGTEALLYLLESRDDVVFFSHINFERQCLAFSWIGLRAGSNCDFIAFVV